MAPQAGQCAAFDRGEIQASRCRGLEVRNFLPGGRRREERSSETLVRQELSEKDFDVSLRHPEFLPPPYRRSRPPETDKSESTGEAWLLQDLCHGRARRGGAAQALRHERGARKKRGDARRILRNGFADFRAHCRNIDSGVAAVARLVRGCPRLGRPHRGLARNPRAAERRFRGAMGFTVPNPRFRQTAMPYLWMRE